MPSGKILIVDDDSNIRFVARMSLEHDWQVSEAENGQRGLELAEQERPDVILLDMMMPGMHGGEALARMRKLSVLDNTPIIFMTAKVQTHEVEGYFKCGAAGLISKPFDPMSLSSEIQKLALAFQVGRQGAALC